MWRRPLSLVLFAISMLPVTAFAQLKPVGTGGPGPYKADHLTVELVAAQPEIAAGGEQTVGLVFTLEDKWHVYWVNPGDSGEAPSVAWTLPRGLTVNAMEYPAPSRLPLGPLMDYGFEDAVAFPMRVHAGAGLKAGKGGLVPLAGKVKWLVCSSSRCLPGSAMMGIDLKLVPAAQGARVRSATEAAEKVGPLGSAFAHLPKPLPAGYSVRATGSAQSFDLDVKTGKQEKDAEFYPFSNDGDNAIANAAEQQIESRDDGVLLTVQRGPDVKQLPASVRGVLKFSDDEAYVIDVPVTAGAAHVARTQTSPSQQNGAGQIGVLAAIGLALLGGALLNLMPCVFPVLFLKALTLVGHTAGEERNALRHSLAYAAGILVSFWVLLGALLALRSGGSHLGWGFQMQSPGFVAVLAIGIFFFALSLAGMFDIGLSITGLGGTLKTSEGYRGSFLTGVLATVVATPCTAPFMGSALGFVLTQSLFVAFSVITALGVGLAIPYILLSAQPAWTRFLPKPGAWMEVLKQVTSVPLFATVIWLVYLYANLFPLDAGLVNAAALLAALLVVSIAGWVLHRWPAGWKSFAVVAVIVVLSIALPFHYRAEEKKASVWQVYSAEAVRAARAEHHPVFVDFTAKWCLSCQVNEKAVLDTETVQKQFRDAGAVLLRADWTRYDPAITDALASVGRNGVPTYVVYPADASKPADVLPEVLSKDVVVGALQRDLK